MARVTRTDIPDSLETIFRIEISTNHHQEIHVPIWEADEAETKIQALDFNASKGKSDTKDVLI